MYLQARERNPSRCSRFTRNWNPIEAEALNSERDAVLSMDVQLASDKRYRLHGGRDNYLDMLRSLHGKTDSPSTISLKQASTIAEIRTQVSDQRAAGFIPPGSRGWA